ncbi:hypothetical protein [uncultured Phycicoccus sp.]|uniref:hypothetical protein n=1 Tax=uncultured Phycicoccus sp. TaxID=661422 RepID=UPI00262ED678|nr:hypothetical protein [uncultured Phycicoccus sp.]
MECVRGVLAGHSYQKVADDLGYANRGTVHRIVHTALARHEAENVEDFRALELARLDHLQAAFFPAATSGDVKAAEVVLKVMAARCRLLSLDRAARSDPNRAQNLVVVGGTKEEFESALLAGQMQGSGRE